MDESGVRAWWMDGWMEVDLVRVLPQSEVTRLALIHFLKRFQETRTSDSTTAALLTNLIRGRCERARTGIVYAWIEVRYLKGSYHIPQALARVWAGPKGPSQRNNSAAEDVTHTSKAAKSMRRSFRSAIAGTGLSAFQEIPQKPRTPPKGHQKMAAKQRCGPSC